MLAPELKVPDCTGKMFKRVTFDIYPSLETRLGTKKEQLGKPTKIKMNM